MDRTTIKKNFLRDVADILSMNEDLMPSEFEDETPDGRRWQEVRDEFVRELKRRSRELK